MFKNYHQNAKIIDGKWILNISLQDHGIQQPAFVDSSFPYIQVHPMEFDFLMKNLQNNSSFTLKNETKDQKTIFYHESNKSCQESVKNLKPFLINIEGKKSLF
jgi:hypothetical protein